MKAIVVLSLIASAAARGPRASQLSPSYSYEQYLADFGKQGTESGRKLFESRLKDILAHNANPSKTYTKGVNMFTDQEKTPKGRVPIRPREPAPLTDKRVLAMEQAELPLSVDWRQLGVVSEVKNQGNCGSCWAFATTATVESHVAIATGMLFSLSPQQLVSCSANPDDCGGTGGCEGSVPELAMDTIIEEGFAEEWAYPYTSYHGVSGSTCQDLGTFIPKVAGITGRVTLPANNASSVIAALAAVGPLAINVDASTWHDYEGGVYTGCSYSDMDIDHVVVLVGYGTDPDNGLDYWLVRNSWSASWGEQGYIRLLRDPVDATPCGVDPTPMDGTDCADGPDVQYPCGQCGVVFDVSYPTGAFAY